ncbi:MAG: ATP-binding protein [Burkholderiales bacterium]
MTTLHLGRWSLPLPRGAALVTTFVALYVALDWVSLIDPLGPLRITPWNPPPGLALFLLLRTGLGMVPWLVVATLLAEILVRGFSAPWPVMVAAALLLSGGYAAVAALLRGPLALSAAFSTLRDVTMFTCTVGAATLVIAVAYVALFAAADVIGPPDYARSVAQFWIGDLIGVVVLTPALLVATRETRAANPKPGETALQAAAIVAALFVVFGSGVGDELKLFYVLFLPLVWIAMRRGLAGTTAATLLVQVGLIGALLFGGHRPGVVLDFQFLMLALALTALYLGASVDERRAAEATLRDKQAELDRTLRAAAASELASALAHELNQPLSAIGTYTRAAQLMLERGDPDGELTETMRKVVAEAARAGTVMRRLREFVRTGALRKERLRTADLLVEAATAARGRADRHATLIAVTAPADVPAVLGDRVQLETVLHNLIANAIDAQNGQDGARTVRLTAARQDDAWVRLCVADDGPGVPPELATTLFHPLVTSKTHGLGLGLAISRTIVEAHGGRLWLDPVARGACFCLTLPVAS